MIIFTEETVRLINKLKELKENVELLNDIDTLAKMTPVDTSRNRQIIEIIKRKYYAEIQIIANIEKRNLSTVNPPKPFETIAEEIRSLIWVLEKVGIYRYLKSKSKEESLDILSKNNFAELFIDIVD